MIDAQVGGHQGSPRGNQGVLGSIPKREESNPVLKYRVPHGSHSLSPGSNSLTHTLRMDADQTGLFNKRN
jgi:hypothetical protein